MMHNEEIERKMNFIVKQQAQFASDIQQPRNRKREPSKLSPGPSKLSRAPQRLSLCQQRLWAAATVSQMGDILTRFANVTHAGFSEVNAKINALVDAQIRTEESLARTDENLNSFIAAVGRRFREDRKGK